MWRAISLLLLLAIPAGARPLGWNLEEWSNFNTSHYACDLMKETSETWTAGAGASGLTQSGGWPTGMTGGANVYYSVVTRLDQLHADISEPGDIAHYPLGEYTIKCDGTVKVGVFRNGPDLTYQCSGTNTHTFTVSATTGEGLEIRVYGDTITNTGSAHLFQVHPSGSNPAACDPATDTFNPLFLKALKGASWARFMDWQGPVYAEGTFEALVDWSDRTPLTARTWVSTNDTDGVGTPPELPILLANELYEETGQIMSPWLVFPVKSSDDYHTEYAAYAETTLNAAIPFVGLEWCNECWNTGGAYIDQFNAVLALANAASITGSDGDKVKKYQAQRSQEVWAIWEDAFAGVTRLKRILGMQNKDCCSPSDAATYLNFDPAGATFGATYLNTDWAAFAPYYGLGSSGHSKHTQNALSASYDGVSNAQCNTDSAHITDAGTTEFDCCLTTPDSCVGIRSWSPDQFCASMLVNVSSVVQQFATNVAAVEAFTNGDGAVVRAVTYEGGDHSDRVGGSDANDTAEHDTTLVAANHTAHRHPCMEKVVNDYLDALYAANHGHPLVMFQLITKWSRFRQFGWAEYLQNADGTRDYCRAPRYRGAFYWSQKP